MAAFEALNYLVSWYSFNGLQRMPMSMDQKGKTSGSDCDGVLRGNKEWLGTFGTG